MVRFMAQTRKTSSKWKEPSQAEALAPAPCAAEGCSGFGEYRAPRSREELRNYQWFCLEHVREYNKKWNYFADMDESAIEEFIRDAVTGHRPTWEREGRRHVHGTAYRVETLEEALRSFFHRAPASSAGTRANLPPKERQALAVLGAPPGSSPAELKARYRVLVKEYHPDLHAGDKAREDRFKKITEAYAYLNELHKQRPMQ